MFLRCRLCKAKCFGTTVSCLFGLLVCLGPNSVGLAADPKASRPSEDHLQRLIQDASSSDRDAWMPAAEKLGAIATEDEAFRGTIWEEARIDTLGQRFVLIEPGTFTMGPDWHRTANYQQAHSVELSQPFYLSVTEVTNAQFEAFRKSSKTSKYSPEPDSPVVRVKWKEAVAYCAFLSEKEGVRYRLPTEAEWEYACRAGTKHTWSHGRFRWGLSQYAWCKDAKGRASRVAQLKPNAWGLYDMQGNVFEWVSDWFSNGYYADCVEQGVVIDPTGPAKGRFMGSHVLRGGAWITNVAETCCSTARFPLPTFDRAPFQKQRAGFRDVVGFRVVREVE